MARILEIADGKPMADVVIGDKGAEYVVVKSVEEIPDEKFDVVFSFGDLQRHSQLEVAGIINAMVEHVKPMGEIQIFVPSVDHAISALEFSSDPVIALWELWGSEAVPHRCGFTMRILRALLEEKGIVTRRAGEYAYLVRFGERHKKAVYNFVIGAKLD